MPKGQYHRPIIFSGLQGRDNLAWAAGFWDGEGSSCICWKRTRANGTANNYPQCSISQSGDLGHEVLTHFDTAIGKLGCLYGPRPPGRNQTLIRWQWEANGFIKVQAIMAMLWPWLGTIKREQFITTLRTAS